MRARSGTVSHARHKKVRQATKGMSKHRRRSYRLGKQAVIRAAQYAYRDRRNRKRDFRRLWIMRINAAAREEGTTYAKLMSNLKAANITLDRKVLAELAYSEPAAFKEVVKVASK